MSLPEAICIDFETEAIGARPQDYPPRPVGVAVHVPGSDPMYLAWGHPSENNCDRAHAARLLRAVYADGRSLLCHNGEFDLEVAENEFQLPFPPPDRWHDSMLLAYLRNPHERTLALKELAASRLNMPPEERDAVREWLVANKICARNDKKWGRFISKAPGNLVGEYAIGDTTRTRALFEEDYAYVAEHGMLVAYEREKRLIPVLLENSRAGVRVDVPLLERSIPLLDAQLEKTDAWLRRKLEAPGVNLDSSEELADALERAGYVTAEDFLPTATGKRSVSKESLAHCLKGVPDLRDVILYREALGTCLGTFLKPWLEAAYRAGGVVHVAWNATRQEQYGRGGTRTGRLSSTPNFQNIYSDENLEKAEKPILARFKDWSPLPRVRGYIIADERDHVLCDRDFSQQELRMLAHYEDDAMKAAYVANPKLDLHEFAAAVILEKMGVSLARKQTKTVAFGLIYGMGKDALADKLEVGVDEASAAKDAYLGTFPGVAELMKDLKACSRRDEPIRTWGGREYYTEPAKIVDGRMREYGYKLVNYLIQGSSADFTKEAILRYDAARKHGRFVLTVHDEIMISVPKRAWRREMAILREAMNDVPGLDVPMLSDGSMGPRWTDMQEAE